MIPTVAAWFERVRRVNLVENYIDEARMFFGLLIDLRRNSSAQEGPVWEGNPMLSAILRKG
jgi:hypothetical protein